jgi:hypothetical protein
MILAILVLALLPFLESESEFYKKSAFSLRFNNFLFSYFLFIVIGLS